MEEYEESEINRFAVEEEVWKSAVLTEWERTWSPPQSGEVCLLNTCTLCGCNNES